jgi:Tol biopolymer transport system component
MVRTGARSSCFAAVSILAVIAAGSASAGPPAAHDSARSNATVRMSVSSAEAQGTGASRLASVSATGRYVVFVSDAANLVRGDTNGVADVFVRDRKRDVTRRVSVNSREVQGHGPSNLSIPAISADGRYVVFTSRAANLVRHDTNGVMDVFVRDRKAGTTERVSVSGHEAQGNRRSGFDTAAAISADGRYVAFTSLASNLVRDDTNRSTDVFLRDRAAGKTRLVSVSSAREHADAESFMPAMSASGQYVAFASAATNLVRHDTNGEWDVFVRDFTTKKTRRVSISSTRAEGDGQSMSPSISADGTRVAFTSWSRNLAPGDSNHHGDVFLRDRTAKTTRLVSVSSNEKQGNRVSFSPSISGNGRYVAFESMASNLSTGDTNGTADVFVRDLSAGKTRRASVATGGVQANGASEVPSINFGGAFVVFVSTATNLVTGDTNGVSDVFLRYIAP